MSASRRCSPATSAPGLGTQGALDRVGAARLDRLCEEVADRQRDPYTLAEQILDGAV